MSSAGATSRFVPYDYGATTRRTDWRAGLRWPSDPRHASKLSNRLMESYLTFAAGEDEDTASVLMLASSSVLSVAIVYAEAGFVAQNAEELGITVVGGPPELRYLSGNTPEDQLLSPDTGASIGRSPKLARVRRLKISASMAGVGGITGQVLRGAVAISRNSLLDAHVRDSGEPVRYCHPETILAGMAEQCESTRRQDGLIEKISNLCEALSDAAGLADPFRGRFRALIRRFALPHTTLAARHLEWCLSAASLPRVIYSGTAGAYVVRLIGVAVGRAGGQAVRFDHGGPSFIASDSLLTHCQVEDAVSTEIIMPSNELSRVAEERHRLSPFADRPVAFSSRTGDPTYFNLHSAEPTRSEKRKVVYAPTLLSGFWQYMLPDLPDVVNLDWHIRLAALLADLPINFWCKPHPEGQIGDLRSPLEAVAQVSYESFEAHLADTDVFVFDLMSSTTFWKGLCTDRSVVYIDLGINRFADWITPSIVARCNVVRARYDDQNLPFVDAQELAAAVCEAPLRCDGAPIRKLMGGII